MMFLLCMLFKENLFIFPEIWLILCHRKDRCLEIDDFGELSPCFFFFLGLFQFEQRVCFVFIFVKCSNTMKKNIVIRTRERVECLLELNAIKPIFYFLVSGLQDHNSLLFIIGSLSACSFIGRVFSCHRSKDIRGRSFVKKVSNAITNETELCSVASFDFVYMPYVG